MKIIKQCKVCNKKFNTNTERIKDGRGKYCSRICQFKGMRREVNIPCSICKKIVTKRYSETFKGNKIGNKKILRHYCSVKCRRLGSSLFDSKRLTNYQKENIGYFKQVLGKKGLSISTDGYYIFNNIKVHRLLMEKYIGRKLLPTEIVHHINFNKLDNRLENLIIVNRSEHNKLHKFFNKQS